MLTHVTPPTVEACAPYDAEPSLGELARPVFESVSDAVLICDATKMRILFANPAAIALYGYSVAEFRALAVTELSFEPRKRSTISVLPNQRKDHSRWPPHRHRMAIRCSSK